MKFAIIPDHCELQVVDASGKTTVHDKAIFLSGAKQGLHSDVVLIKLHVATGNGLSIDWAPVFVKEGVKTTLRPYGPNRGRNWVTSAMIHTKSSPRAKM